MTTTSGSLVQLADYSMIAIDSPENPEPSEESILFANGLVRANPSGGALIATGCYMGPVHVVWATGDRPAEAQLDEWEDVVQVRLRPHHGELVIRGFMESGDDGNSPNLALAPEAPHMLRCSSRGRDRDVGAATETATEEFLIEVWLAAPDDTDAVLKLSSSYGAQLASSSQ